METLTGYLDALASAEPAPGGGSAACVVAAQAAALVAMVARITRASAAWAPVHPLADELSAHADRVRGELLRARRRDEAAYAAFSATRMLPNATDAEKAARAAARREALREAAEAPLASAALTLEVLALVRRAEVLGNRYLASDLACAWDFAEAALRACAHNVRINHELMRDAALVADQSARLHALEQHACELTDATTTDGEAPDTATRRS